MANRATSRKRVFAFGLRRAPDGSAFQKCDSCGVMVPVAIFDMHECKPKQVHVRRKLNPQNHSCKDQEVIEIECSKSEVLNRTLQNPSFADQPRSPFCIFMEDYKRNHRDENHFDVDRRGFDTWKNMSLEEKQKFILEAERVNLTYEKAMLREADVAEVDDEADSVMVGKFDVNYEYWYDSDYSGSP